MKHILLVDDGSNAIELTAAYLSRFGFRVTSARDSQQIKKVILAEVVDVVVVDLDMRQENGLDIVRILASLSDAPMIIISGNRVEEADKVVGLELGASDYLTKPFGNRELLARIRSLARRRSDAAVQRETKAYSFEGWTLHAKQRVLQPTAGRDKRLTAAEFNLLVAFLRAPRQILSREQLIAACRLNNDAIFDRSIDVTVLRLRRKLEVEPAAPKLIKTKRGLGYLLEAHVELHETPKLQRDARKISYR